MNRFLKTKTGGWPLVSPVILFQQALAADLFHDLRKYESQICSAVSASMNHRSVPPSPQAEKSAIIQNQDATFLRRQRKCQNIKTRMQMLHHHFNKTSFCAAFLSWIYTWAEKMHLIASKYRLDDAAQTVDLHPQIQVLNLPLPS